MKILNTKNYHDMANLLATVQSHHSDAIVAGGAIRDLVLNNKTKDIDIFIQHSGSSNILSYAYWSTLLDLQPLIGDFIGVAKGNSKSDSDSGNAKAVRLVFDGRKDGVLFNIVILLVPPIVYINDYFDVGICKAYFDGKKIRLTNDFIIDQRNNTLTVVSKHLTRNLLDRVMKNHMPRLKKKYPNHTVLINEHNLQYV